MIIHRLITRRGARWLDERNPEWFLQVDRPIDLCCEYDCVLGQVYGNFYRARERFRIPAKTLWSRGFFGSWRTGREWTKIVVERKKAYYAARGLSYPHGCRDREFVQAAQEDYELAFAGD